MLGMTGSEEIMANGHSDYDLGKEQGSIVRNVLLNVFCSVRCVLGFVIFADIALTDHVNHQ